MKWKGSGNVPKPGDSEYGNTYGSGKRSEVYGLLNMCNMTVYKSILKMKRRKRKWKKAMQKVYSR